jgi:hypothetical protein
MTGVENKVRHMLLSRLILPLMCIEIQVVSSSRSLPRLEIMEYCGNFHLLEYSKWRPRDFCCLDCVWIGLRKAGNNLTKHAYKCISNNLGVLSFWSLTLYHQHADVLGLIILFGSACLLHSHLK